MIFQNRQADNLNRRRIKIISQTPTEIIADIERADSNVVVDGTPIDANTFNAWKQNVVNDAERVAHEAVSIADQAVSIAQDAAAAVGDGGTSVYVNSVPQASLNFTSDPQTQLNNIKNIIYPIGSIYMSTTSTNPSSFFGGVWEAFAQGRTIIGVGTSDQSFIANTMGGTSRHTLTESEMPSHTHSQQAHTHSTTVTSVGHNHNTGVIIRTDKVGIANDYGNTGNHLCSQTGGLLMQNTDWVSENTVEVIVGVTNVSSTAINNSTGGGQSHNNLPPYIVTYIWRRTA